MYSPPEAFICPATGHVRNRRRTRDGTLTPDDAMCPLHGVPLFRDCPTCQRQWPIPEDLSLNPSQGAPFCAKCAAPAPWLKRRDLIEWVQHQIQVAQDIPSPKRLELGEILEHLQGMDAEDTRAAAAWQKVRDAAPKVWAAMRPIRDALIGEAVKKALGL